MDVKSSNPSYLIFMLSLSIFAIALLTVDTIFSVNHNVQTIIEYTDTLICGFFFLDFLIMLFRSDEKLRYIITWGWLDFLSSIPMLSTLRWGRSARIVRIFRVLRGIRSARVLTSFILERRAQSAMLAATLAAIILITISSISVLHFEGIPEANIKTGEDAIWWSLVTITTVGYGDKYPVTPEGRVIAVVLMIAGVGLFSTLSGFIAAWFLHPGQTASETNLRNLESEIRELRRSIEDRDNSP
jgi:voltage-gated potassium channel